MPSNMIKDIPDELTPNQIAIVEGLCTLYDRGARTSDLKGVANLSNTTFYEVLKSLAKRGIIDKDGRYDPWILTQYGKQVAIKNGLLRKISTSA